MGASGWLRPGDVLVLTLTGHGLKDPDTAIANSDAAVSIPAELARLLRARARLRARLMKVVVVQADGMADEPVDALGNQTPLEVARTPHLDHMASRGILGLTRAIPRGMAPESDVGTMALLGYDPERYHTGRAALEAIARDIPLAAADVAFRLDLMTLRDRGGRRGAARGRGPRRR